MKTPGNSKLNLKSGRKSSYFVSTLAILAAAGMAFWATRSISYRWLAGDQNAIIAKVSGLTLTQSQLERAVNEKLWQEGSNEIISEEKLKTIRRAALEDLIDEILLSQELKKTASPPSVSDEEIHERMRRLETRFSSRSEFETAMRSQGIPDRNALLARMAGMIWKEKLIELKIADQVKVTEEEARKWYEAHLSQIAHPTRLRARHIFLPTLDHSPEEARQKLEAAQAELTSHQKEFATLAKELSEDPATQYTGGDLGWMTQQRLPADFAAPLFAMELDKPSLLQTKLGWHLVEVAEKKPSETRKFEEAKSEIIAALQAVKRQNAIREMKASLRNSNQREIEITNSL